MNHAELVWPALAAGCLLSFSLSCWISMATTDSEKDAYRISVAERFLGEGRLALSRHFYEQADLYFHGGWEHANKEAFHDSVFQQLEAEISPRHHVHISGEKVKELMPWLRMATLIEPDNATMYLDAAFWLIHESKRPDLAEKVLSEAQVNCPFNVQIQLEKGRLFLMEGKIAAAKRAFEAGLAFCPGPAKTEDFDTKDARARLLLYRALLHEADHENKEAIAELKEILVLFPERIAIRDRINELETKGEASLLASGVWSDMLKKESVRKEDDHCTHPGEE